MNACTCRYLVEKTAAADGPFHGVPSLGQHGAVDAAPGVHHAGQAPEPPEAARQRDGGVFPGPASTGQEGQDNAEKREHEKIEREKEAKETKGGKTEGP